jgi:hypothetical protein
MRKVPLAILVFLLVAGMSTACATRQKKVVKELGEPGPVNCSTAQGDLRLLQHEKANVAERVAEGITAIYPAGLVVGLLTRTEGTKYDKRIAQIKETCGIE